MLMNYGSVASLRRNLGMLDDEEQQGQQGRPSVPPLDPRNINKPFVPSPPPQKAMQPADLMRLQAAVPENVTSLLNADQQRNAVPGFWTRFGNWLAEGKGTREQIQDRVKEQLGLEIAGEGVRHHREGDVAAADQEARISSLLESLGPPPSDSEGINLWLRKVHAGMTAIPSMRAANPLNNALDNIQPRGASSSAAAQWRNDVLGEDGKPYQVQYDPATGREIQRVPQYERPIKGDDLTQWQLAQLDLARQRLAKTGQSRTGAMLKKARVTNDTGLATVKQVMADLDKPGPEGEESVGWKAYLPDALLNRWFPEGVGTRSGLQNVGSLILHDRFGAALTKTELQRAGFIPFDTDRADVAKSKLAKLVQFIEMQNAALDDQTADEEPDTPKPTGKTKKIIVNGKTFIVPDE